MYKYKEDLALNNLQWLICHKTKQNKLATNIDTDMLAPTRTCKFHSKSSESHPGFRFVAHPSLSIDLTYTETKREFLFL